MDLESEQPAYLDVWQPGDPRSKLSGEAQRVQEDKSRVAQPVQGRGTHARNAQSIKWVSGRYPSIAHAGGWEGLPCVSDDSAISVVKIVVGWCFSTHS